MRTITSLGGAALLLALCTPAWSADANIERLYDTYCVQCHGVNRDGKGINAAHMSVQPRDHSDAKTMGDIPDDQLYKAIRDGGLAVDKSVLMPAWKSVFSDEQIKGLVAYLREVCQCGPGYDR